MVIELSRQFVRNIYSKRIKHIKYKLCITIVIYNPQGQVESPYRFSFLVYHFRTQVGMATCLHNSRYMFLNYIFKISYIYIQGHNWGGRMFFFHFWSQRIGIPPKFSSKNLISPLSFMQRIRPPFLYEKNLKFTKTT